MPHTFQRTPALKNRTKKAQNKEKEKRQTWKERSLHLLLDGFFVLATLNLTNLSQQYEKGGVKNDVRPLKLAVSYADDV